MKKLIASVIVPVVIALTGGCAARLYENKVTTTFPDGRVVVEEVRAKVDSFCYDSSLEGFEWTSSNVTVRVNRHGSSGGVSNVVAICNVLEKTADAAKAVAEATK